MAEERPIIEARQYYLNALGVWVPVTPTTPLPVDTSPGAKTTTTILDVASIDAATTTVLGDCAAIDLSGGPDTLTITVETTYNATATLGIKIHIRTSHDGTDYDTIDWDSWNPSFTAGATIRQMKHYDTSPMYVKVLVENLDAVRTVTDVKVIATVGV